MMGRTPDHVGGFFCGYAAVPEVFAGAGKEYGERVVKFYGYCAKIIFGRHTPLSRRRLTAPTRLTSKASRPCTPELSRRKTAASS